MQAIIPQYVRHNTYYYIYKAGTHFKYPDDLSAMKTLQDSYREFFDYDPLDFSREWKEYWKRYVFGPLGPSYHDIMRLAAKDEDHVALWKYVSHTTPAKPFSSASSNVYPYMVSCRALQSLQLEHAQDE